MYFSTKNPDGTWTAGALIPAPAQSPNCSNDNPFVVGNSTVGVDLYFESYRADLTCTAGNGKRHIYHSFFDPLTQTFSAVDKVAGLNGTEALDEDMQVHITTDKKQAYWTATRFTSVGVPVDYAIYTAELVGTAFMNPRPILRPNFLSPYTGMLIFPGEVNVVEVPQGWLIYMICGIAQNESATTSKGATLKICRMKKARTSEHTAAKKNQHGRLVGFAVYLARWEASLFYVFPLRLCTMAFGWITEFNSNQGPRTRGSAEKHNQSF